MTRHLAVPLRCLAHTRSGDKGNTSNIAVIAHHPAFHAVLRTELTEEVVTRRMAPLVKGQITRYEAGNLHAFNFVCEGALGGGVSRSLYLDNYGKALSSALLDLPIALPPHLLAHVDPQRLAQAGVSIGGGETPPVPWTLEEEADRYCRPQAVRQGEEGRCDIGAFEFEGGGRLDHMTVGFVTHGRLNTQRDNAILLLPGTTNTRHSADGYIGAGNAFDPDRHFIVAFDAIGAGTSSKPSDGLGADFPAYNIRDMVRAQFQAVTGFFGLTRVAAVAGASMGAFQALEWAVAHPRFMDRAVLMVPAARASHIFQSVVGAVQEVLQLDPRWGNPMISMRELPALRAAVRLYFPWTVTDAFLERMPRALVEREIQSAIERSAQWHPWDYLRRYQASASHDVAAPFGGDLAQALRQVQARTLILPSSTERLLGIHSGKELLQHIAGARMHEVETDRGHLGWRAVEGARESRFIASETARFLKETHA